jgi:hypothetical protein
MKTFVLIGLVVLMPFAALMAQSGQWQSMDGPYYIYNVTSISIGYQDNQTNAYAVGSDLKDSQNQYVYSYQGASPINQWSNVNQPFRIPGIKYISASRYYGQTAYASVPDDSPIGTAGVYHKTPLLDWRPTDDQPENTSFTGIVAHPNTANICFTSCKHVDGVSSIYKTENSGADWSAASNLPSTNDCNAICIDPNSGNQLSTTTVYGCFQTDGIYRSTNGGNTWGNRFDLYGDDAIYNGGYVAVKKNDASHIYAITWRWDDYTNDSYFTLWRTTDAGLNWINKEYGTDSIYAVTVSNSQGIDSLWIISNLYAYYTWSPFNIQHYIGAGLHDTLYLGGRPPGLPLLAMTGQPRRGCNAINAAK